MTHDKMKCLAYLVIIARKKRKDELLSALMKMDAHAITAMYGKEAIRTGYLADALGFAPDESRVVIGCIAAEDAADSILDMLADKFDFDKPHTGIAFTIDIHRLSV